jgi:Zn-dependent peptidase ImmA (M78 family)
MTSSNKAARVQSQRLLAWLHRIAEYLREFVETPQVCIPEFGFPQDPSRITNDDIERAASDMRNMWKLGDGPIANVLRLIENNGIIVGRDELEGDSLTSVSAWEEAAEHPYVLLTSQQPPTDIRMELAQCLGHLLLHRSVPQQRLASANDASILKEQSRRFGRALLMPATSFSQDVYSISLETLRLLKQKWRTPIWSMIYRLQDLEMLSEDQSRRLWIGRSKRGWASREPLEDELPKEAPKLLAEAVTLLINEQIIVKPDILNATALADRDIEMLAALPTGYLTDNMPVVNIISPDKRKTLSRTRTDQHGSGDVVEFPAAPQLDPWKKRKGVM